MNASLSRHCKGAQVLTLMTVFTLSIFGRVTCAEGAQKILSTAEVTQLKVSPERQRVLEEGAKREAELMIYSVASGMESVATAFMRKYPFVKTEIFRTRSQALVERTRAESRVGRLGGDVLVGNTRIYLPLQELLAPFKSQEANFSVAPHAAISSVTLIVFAYNTLKVTSAEVPRKLEDLLLPRWKGKLGFYGPPNTFPALWTGGLIDVMGEDKAVSFLKKFASQTPFFYDSGGVGMQALVSGETHIGANTTASSMSTKTSGAPIDWIPLEPVPAVINLTGVFRQSRHPHSAMLFLDFLLGPEGQESVRGAGNYLGIKDIEKREAWGVKLPKNIRMESLADEKHFPKWNKLFLETVVKKN